MEGGVQNDEPVGSDSAELKHEPSGLGSEPKSVDEMMLGGTDCDPRRLSLSDQERGVDEPDALDDPDEWSSRLPRR